MRNDPTTAADCLATARKNRFLDQGKRRPADGTARVGGPVIVRSGFNGHGADPGPSDRRVNARQRSTFVTDVCQLSNKLVPIAAKPRLRPVHASTL